MKSFIETFGKQLEDALELANKAVITPQRKGIRNVVASGLGGSAFGGEIVKGYIAGKAKVPFVISREYDIPAYVGRNTLFLACSYSGNTEETLAATELAEAQGAEIVCITSGGKLAEWAKSKGKNLYLIPAGYPPRAAVGFAFVAQLQVLYAYKLIANFRKDLDVAIRTVQGFNDHSAAQKLAKTMPSRFLYLYASGKMESIAIRWRQQIEENSKQLACHHIVPEMNHNELVGWKQPAENIHLSHATFIESSYDHERVTMRMKLNKEVIRGCTKEVHTVKAKGRGYLAQLMYLLHFGDWVSFYLAEYNNEDPYPVKVIDALKNALANS